MSEISDGPPGDAPGLSDVRRLDAEAVLEELVDQRAVAAAAEARVLGLAVHYVDLHPVTDLDSAARPDGPDQAWGALAGQEPAGVAGAGTPAVADYAVEALGARLGLPYGAAWSLIADSVELCHRLPALWARVQAGQLPAWRARAVARDTTALSQAAARFVDRQLAILIDRRRWLSAAKLRHLVHEAALIDDPDRQQALEEAALGSLGVWFDHHTDTAATSVTHLKATLEASDAYDLDAALSGLADTMGRLGDTTTTDTRRAAALALLAHPQCLLDLATGTHPQPQDRPNDQPCDDQPEDRCDDQPGSRGDSSGSNVPVGGPVEDATVDDRRIAAGGTSGSPFGGWTGAKTGSQSTVNLYVHATLADLAAHTGTRADTGTCGRGAEPTSGPDNAEPTTGSETANGYGLVERFGSAALDIIGRWADRCHQIIIRPVLDPTSVIPHPDGAGPDGAGPVTVTGLDATATRPVDRHDPPDPMREHVILRDGACVFPGCHVDARHTDLDHIDPYQDPGDDPDEKPPPQTHPGNLSCLCRRHHRLKTFTAWDYVRRDDGSYDWTDPTGRTYQTFSLPRRAALT